MVLLCIVGVLFRFVLYRYQRWCGWQLIFFCTSVLNLPLALFALQVVRLLALNQWGKYITGTLCFALKLSTVWYCMVLKMFGYVNKVPLLIAWFYLSVVHSSVLLSLYRAQGKKANIHQQTTNWHSGDNQSVGSSAPVVSRWLWPGNMTFLEVDTMVVKLVDSGFFAQLSLPSTFVFFS